MRKKTISNDNDVTTKMFRLYKIVIPNYFYVVRAFIILCSILLIGALLFSGCGSDKGNGNQNKGDGNSEGDDSKITAAIPVQAAAVKRGDISLSLMQTTTIEAIRQVDILTKVSGQVVKLPVEEGVKVKKGDL